MPVTMQQNQNSIENLNTGLYLKYKSSKMDVVIMCVYIL